MHKKDVEAILIIDDEDSVLEIGRQFLQRYGYTVLTASHSDEGITLYSKSAVDLVLLDLSLPGVDGLKCLEKLLSIDPNAKIIIISGDPLNGRIQDTLKIGAKAFLAKPYRLTELLNAVRKVLGGSLQEKRSTGNI